MYSKLRHDVQYRKDVAERVGVGFDVPARLNVKVVNIGAAKAQLNLVEPKIIAYGIAEFAVKC